MRSERTGGQVDNIMPAPTSLAWRRNNKKRSYRKQIARQLRTQYVEGIYSNSATLKSRLGVTEGR